MKNKNSRPAISAYVGRSPACMPQCYPHGAFCCRSGQRHAHRWPPGGHGGFPNCPSFPPVCPVYTTAGETASVIIAAFLSRLMSWKCDLDCDDCVSSIFFQQYALTVVRSAHQHTEEEVRGCHQQGWYHLIGWRK